MWYNNFPFYLVFQLRIKVHVRFLLLKFPVSQLTQSNNKSNYDYPKHSCSYLHLSLLLNHRYWRPVSSQLRYIESRTLLTQVLDQFAYFREAIQPTQILLDYNSFLIMGDINASVFLWENVSVNNCMYYVFLLNGK